MKISQEQNRKCKIANKAGIFALSLLAASSAVYAFSPITKTNAQELSGQKTVGLAIDINPVIGIRLNTNSVYIRGNLNSFSSGGAVVESTTNSKYGYTLTIEDADGDTSLKAKNPKIHDSISSTFEGGKTADNMGNNSWGYSLDDETFYAVPAKNNPASLKRTDSPNLNGYDQTSLYFGVKVGDLLASGRYDDTVIFTAYVNGQDGEPADGTSVNEPGDASGDVISEFTESTMQGFSCSSLSSGSTRTLTDARDGNEYTVAKLADGNCWMTQNLRIRGKKLNSTSSNLNDGETFDLPPSTTKANTESGLHVFYDDTYGAYYNFNTVTAGWGGSAGAASSSPTDICPKGWRLPTGGSGSEYDRIYELYGTVALVTATPIPAFTPSGYIDTTFGELKYTDKYGYYWTGSTNTASKSWYFAFSNSTVWKTFSTYRNSTYAARCIVK